MGWATGSRNSEVVAEAAFGKAAVAVDILDRLFMTQSRRSRASAIGEPIRQLRRRADVLALGIAQCYSGTLAPCSPARSIAPFRKPFAFISAMKSVASLAAAGLPLPYAMWSSVVI